jgi:hypothetical protein
MGALEIVMRTAEQRVSKDVFEPKLGMVFDSYEEAYEFYNLYLNHAGIYVSKRGKLQFYY